MSDQHAAPETNLAICYVTDHNYLYGTLLSIASLRRFVDKTAAPIFLFLLDPDDVADAEVLSCALRLGIHVLPASLGDHLRGDDITWNRTHVPLSALGRFFVEASLPSTVSRILYLDGDTVFVRDPTPLLRLDIPSGYMAAAEDISYFLHKELGRHGKRTRSYFDALGIDGRCGYFNSGVILTCRYAWRDLSQDAIHYILANSDRCRFHDQSALNAVAGHRRLRLSPRWNFQTPFRYLGMQRTVDPYVLHFTGFTKPWMGAVRPWDYLRATIDELSDELGPMALPRNGLNAREISYYNKMSRNVEMRLWSVLAPRLMSRRSEMARLLASSIL